MAGKALATAAVAAPVGVMAGFSLNPQQAIGLLKWLNEALGPVGFVAILCLGAGLSISVYGNWLMWKRLKEKDEECRTEMKEAASSWERRFQDLRADIKESFGIGAALTKQVTILVERANPTNTSVRSS